MKKEVGRKVRSDKKRKVSPTIDIHLRESIYRLAYVSNTPVKDIGEAICRSGLLSKQVIEYLSMNFRRPIRLMNTFYMGDLSRSSVQKRSSPDSTDRITIRFEQQTYNNLAALAYALDVTPSRACALLLGAGIHTTDFLNDFFKDYLHIHLTDKRMKELEKVMKFLEANNPYKEEISWAVLLSTIYDEMRDGVSNISEAIGEFISHWRK
ncbi:hypothetical protein [Psychrobacillus sp. L3]|uniref:hypothetical protein n=1 Tax=Psychrobacillus sp. L3 TaxID=3236891 RepID=UPI0036F4083D